MSTDGLTLEANSRDKDSNAINVRFKDKIKKWGGQTEHQKTGRRRL